MTTMIRFQRVAQLWNWLPGFRGVAEHANVHKAAEALAISASALSRTVKLLESAFGAPLFVRKSSGLELTPLGSELLGLTRTAMRQIDDCIAREEARRGGDGPLFVGITTDVGAAVLARTIARHAAETPPIHVVRIDDDAAGQELLRGTADIVLSHAPLQSDEIVSVHLGDTSFGIYAAAPPVDEPTYVAVASGPPLPPTAKVLCFCDSVDVARAICESSHVLCALPDAVDTRSLHRIADAGEPVALYALHRVPATPGREEPRLGELVARLRFTIAATARPPRS